MTRLLALFGSGETAPTMVKPHRRIFERTGPGLSVLLDTPYGFQENADDISDRAVAYFAESTGRAVEVASLRRGDGDPVEREAALAQVAQAVWVFAGPGSPTYALRQWRGGELPSLLADKLAQGGTVVFSSAAALTFGRYTVPVYEIYKAGEAPAWADGMDLLGSPVAVIPHYDNAEGGHHDTRYCYLGERRLQLLEATMPDDGWVLGIDEHTGLVVDLDEGSAEVVGNGRLTLRSHGRSTVLPAGTQVAWADLQGMALGAAGGGPSPAPAGAAVAADAAGDAAAVAAGGGEPAALSGGGTLLVEEIRAAESAFDRALEGRDTDAAVRALLGLEDSLAAWAADTAQSDALDRGRAALRRMVVRLGALAETGARDPASVVGPFVELLLAQRDAARAAKRWGDADAVRDGLIAAGVEVRDTPGGTEWVLK